MKKKKKKKISLGDRVSKTLSAAILVLLIPSVALPKLLQQSRSAAGNGGKKGRRGLTDSR